MKKKNTLFECEHCGYQSTKWMGKCAQCNAWDSMVEIKQHMIPEKNSFRSGRNIEKPVPLSDVDEENTRRVKSKISEFDRVLGGGFVPGSLILIGGEPGIGKSTLMLQVCSEFASEKKVLYFSGEESSAQIKSRAKRIQALPKSLLMSNEISLEGILEIIEEVKPDLVVIDSIQTVFSNELNSAAGTVSQIREATQRFLYISKQKHIPFVIIGHITKEGSIAGPKILEHMVDTVLYFEGERFYSRRIIRAVKNRFGSTNEIGIFEMTEKGLVPVENPSEIFLSHSDDKIPGSSVVAAIEGSRALLVEIQALVSESSFGNPRRMAIGADINRVHMLIAIMEKVLDFSIQRDDIYVNAAGGISVHEPASDLGIVFAVSSSFLNRPLEKTDAFIGEVGLSGEIRGVSQIEKRVSEVKALGFKRVFIPFVDTEKIMKMSSKEFTIIRSKHLKDAISDIL